METTKLGAQILVPSLQERVELLFELLPKQISTDGRMSNGDVG